MKARAGSLVSHDATCLWIGSVQEALRTAEACDHIPRGERELISG